MPLTVRVDVKTERLLLRLARKRGETKSEIIRDAIGVLAKEVRVQEATEPPYEKVRDLIGSVSGGSADLSTRTGEKFRRALVGRREKPGR
ncbi:MAG: ribbon-helix-helix protein, CopG family [Nitrospira sp.]|nr:ribbon-helix-helix protein, CopG family [Nitrospira sp.]